MVEAVPMGIDGIMIIVTKVNNKDKKGNTAADLLQQGGRAILEKLYQEH